MIKIIRRINHFVVYSSVGNMIGRILIISGKPQIVFDDLRYYDLEELTQIIEYMKGL